MIDSYKYLRDDYKENRLRGRIIIARLFQSFSTIFIELVLSRRVGIYKYIDNNFDLNDLITYAFEWTNSYMIWFVNNRIIYQTNKFFDQDGNSIEIIDENRAYLPFDYPFKLILSIESNKYLNYPDEQKNGPTNPTRNFLEIESVIVYGILDQITTTNYTQIIESEFDYTIISTVSILILIIITTMVFTIYILRRSLVKTRNARAQLQEEYEAQKKYYEDFIYDYNQRFRNSYLEIFSEEDEWLVIFVFE